jgi:hypothetical protein
MLNWLRVVVMVFAGTMAAMGTLSVVLGGPALPGGSGGITGPVVLVVCWALAWWGAQAIRD